MREEATAPRDARLAQALESLPAGPILVGYSGGSDSTALLHALASRDEVRQRGLRAIHVDHALHSDSGNWAAHCVAFCDKLNIKLTVCAVEVEADKGDGLESAARRARHCAFADVLADGETLALAHHADDQMETVLLKLLRGAGPAGLGGMRRMRPFADGKLWRPLLELPRRLLADYARDHGLNWLDDPANADPRYARSYLRQHVVPALDPHWPEASKAIGHAARLCRAAADYLEQEADHALASLAPDSEDLLPAMPWRELADAIRPLVLERWLRRRDLPAPTTTQRLELERQVATADADRVPCLQWPGANVRLWRGNLYAEAPRDPPPASWRSDWDGTELALPGGGTLALDPTVEPLAPPLTIRYRTGGERIREACAAHHKTLRNLWQDLALPPWQRARCPLIYRDNELLAVADLRCSAAGEALFRRLGSEPIWHRD